MRPRIGLRITDLIALILLALLCVFLGYLAFHVERWWEWLFIGAIILCLGLQTREYFIHRAAAPTNRQRSAQRKQRPAGKRRAAGATGRRSNRSASDRRRGTAPPSPPPNVKKADAGEFLHSLHELDEQEPAEKAPSAKAPEPPEGGEGKAAGDTPE